jgi:hypothetical protein
MTKAGAGGAVRATGVDRTGARRVQPANVTSSSASRMTRSFGICIDPLYTQRVCPLVTLSNSDIVILCCAQNDKAGSLQL